MPRGASVGNVRAGGVHAPGAGPPTGNVNAARPAEGRQYGRALGAQRMRAAYDPDGQLSYADVCGEAGRGSWAARMGSRVACTVRHCFSVAKRNLWRQGKDLDHEMEDACAAAAFVVLVVWCS